MTATRWWVRMFARWQARIDASTQEINMGLRMVSSGGIGSGALKYFGFGEFVLPFLALLAGCLVTYAYLTFEGGVKNQVAKDRQDMISNFSGPGMLMDDTLIGIAMWTAINGEEPSQQEREMIERAVGQQWSEYRDGVNLSDD